MPRMKPGATLIGDVVSSRSARSRVALHERLLELIEQVNGSTHPVTPLRITVGDEYQGSFATVGDALTAAFQLQLLGLPDVDLRHGLGWGDIEVLSEEPRVEDGPGWWEAREAIEYVAREQRRRPHRTLRSRFHSAEPSHESAAVNAALVTRDALLGGLDDRSLSVLRGLLSGMSQTQIARAESITPSAVSQRVLRDGLAAIVSATELLSEVR